MKFTRWAIAPALLLATSASAQITSYACTAPAPGKTGYVPREGVPWPAINDTLGINNGTTWNDKVPYALCLGDGYARTELRDTAYDNGIGDHAAGESWKRRSEFETTSKYQNDVDSWLGFTMRTHVNNLSWGFSVRDMQVHWPSGASPAVGISEKYANGRLALVVSIKNDATNNKTIGQITVPQDAAEDVVVNFKLAKAGYVRVWVNGKQIANYSGFVGSVKENGYRLRFGNYGTIAGMSVVTEFKNLTTPKSATVSLMGRVSAPLTF